jgi:hypothetical protein
MVENVFSREKTEGTVIQIMIKIAITVKNSGLLLNIGKFLLSLR